MTEEQIKKKVEVIKDLASVINRHSLENTSNTPDFILAEYLYYCLMDFDWAVNRREMWYGRRITPGIPEK